MVQLKLIGEPTDLYKIKEAIEAALNPDVEFDIDEIATTLPQEYCMNLKVKIWNYLNV